MICFIQVKLQDFGEFIFQSKSDGCSIHKVETSSVKLMHLIEQNLVQSNLNMHFLPEKKTIDSIQSDEMNQNKSLPMTHFTDVMSCDFALDIISCCGVLFDCVSSLKRVQLIWCVELLFSASGKVRFFHSIPKWPQ